MSDAFVPCSVHDREWYAERLLEIAERLEGSYDEAVLLHILPILADGLEQSHADSVVGGKP